MVGWHARESQATRLLKAKALLETNPLTFLGCFSLANRVLDSKYPIDSQCCCRSVGCHSSTSCVLCATWERRACSSGSNPATSTSLFRDVCVEDACDIETYYETLTDPAVHGMLRGSPLRSEV